MGKLSVAHMKWWKVIGGMFWSFSISEGHPRTPEGSQLTTYCDIRSQDKTSYNGIISLWENCVLLVWKEECLMIWDMFWQFSGSEGPLQGSPMFPNWQPSVPWKVELKYLMGGFHYRITGCCLHQRWKKEYLRNLRHVLAVFWLLGASKGPWRCPIVSNGQPSEPWEVKKKYFTMGWFHYGENWTLVENGIYDSLRHVLVVFWLLGPSPRAPRVPMGSQP